MNNVHDLPLQNKPHDALRDGLRTLKEEAVVSHPLEAVVQKGQQRLLDRDQVLRNVYGSALPAQLAIERQVLGRPLRLPGFESSMLGLEAITGELDDFGFESYIGLPELSEAAPVDLHSAMEAKLPGFKGTKPASRGLF